MKNTLTYILQKNMNHKSIIISILAFCLAFSSCVKEKLENTYNNQEDRIDQFIEKNRYVKTTVDGKTVTDTLRVVYNGGSSRLVTKEGEGEELKSDGMVAFYYAGYTFNGSISNSNLFTTNHLETATSAGWSLTDTEFEILTIDLGEYELINGLHNGLTGVKAGEECQIFFSGKHAFGKRALGIVPANSALVYKIWVESISNE